MTQTHSSADARPDPDLVRQIAPTGVFRASINLGNAVLAGRDPQTGEAIGVSVDLATAFAEHLGVPLQKIVFNEARDSVAAVTAGEADLGFFAVDPLRAAQLRYTAPYVLIEGRYLVREGDALQSADEVDREGLRVMVARGSAYDLHLSRSLKKATIVRAASSPQVVEETLQTGVEVAAGVRQQLEADIARVPGLRMLSGTFMTIPQATAIPRDRSDAAHAEVRRFIEARKADGFVARALARHGIQGVPVAPAEA